MRAKGGAGANGMGLPLCFSGARSALFFVLWVRFIVLDYGLLSGFVFAFAPEPEPGLSLALAWP